MISAKPVPIVEPPPETALYIWVSSAALDALKLPAWFTMPASAGVETLVPPTTHQPAAADPYPASSNSWLSKTQTPVLGLAFAETSGTARLLVLIPKLERP